MGGTDENLTPDCAGGSVIISPSGTVLGEPNYKGEGFVSTDLGIVPLPHSDLALLCLNCTNSTSEAQRSEIGNLLQRRTWST